MPAFAGMAILRSAGLRLLALLLGGLDIAVRQQSSRTAPNSVDRPGQKVFSSSPATKLIIVAATS